ncbi:MAG: DUF2079 domain-containing protein [Ruminococcaceae bacterium]|nr:DUF2079 domain-containing protein [Oscillospiraceae bacterium]
MINSIITALKRFTLRQYIIRLLSAWVMMLLFAFFYSDSEFTLKSFYGNISFPLFVVFTLVFFLLTCLVERDEYITIGLISGITVYFIFLSSYARDYMFSFGLCLVLCVAVVFSDMKRIKLRVDNRALWGLCISGIVIYTLFIGITCSLYYLNYRTSCFDFGIFTQMFYYMKETGECLTTCERDGLLSHFAVHFSPIYYLLLPIYCLIPSPCTLLFAQGLIVASGAIPLLLICRNHKLSNTASLAFVFCYLLYPSFLGGCYYYLHENCFLAPLILWFIYFAEREKGLYAFIFAFLTLTVKEDAPVYVAVIALYFLFANKNYKFNLFILIFSILYFISVLRIMSVFGEGVMADSRYGDYIYDGGGLFTVIKSVLQNPGFAVKQIFREEKILFVLQMAVPLCFLPFAIRKPSGLILLIPFLLVNLMTNYRYQYDIGFQYTFGSGAMLFYSAVVNCSSLPKNRGKVLLCSALCSLIVFMGSFFGKNAVFYDHILDAEKRETINEAVSLIPEDASLAASTFILPNVSHRRVVYELETTKNKADYYIFDLSRDTDESDVTEFMGSDYETLFFEDGIVAVFRSVE